MKITIENLTKKFGNTTAVDNLSVTMESGKMILHDETKNIDTPLTCSFTDRQKAILKAGGLLGYTKGN